MALPDYEAYPIQVRCDYALHGILRDGTLEVKCHHIKCTKGSRVVFHYFDPQTGAMVDTKTYQDPAPRLRGRKR